MFINQKYFVSKKTENFERQCPVCKLKKTPPPKTQKQYRMTHPVIASWKYPFKS